MAPQLSAFYKSIMALGDMKPKFDDEIFTISGRTGSLYRLKWTIIFSFATYKFLALLERLVRSKQNCAKNFEAKCSVRHSSLPEAERSVRDALGFRKCLFLFRDGGYDNRIWEHHSFNADWQALYSCIQLDRHPLFWNFNATGWERAFLWFFVVQFI